LSFVLFQFGLLSSLAVPKPHNLEISVEAVATAVAAQRGGANRIELCVNLAAGGLTPPVELMRAVREQIRLPIFVMIRPRAGDFVYSQAEFGTMQEHTDLAKQSGVNGVVLGILDEGGHVDVTRTRQLVELARPLSVTFHRAFDVSIDLCNSLEAVVLTGASRILTSGGAPTALEGLTALAELVRASQNRILVVPGSGIHAGNIVGIAERVGAVEFHAGLSTVVPDPEKHLDDFETEVRRLARLLAEI
jgi:copper homeostasis protein